MKAGIDYTGIATPFYCHDGNGSFLLHKRGGKSRNEQGKWDMGSGALEHGLTLEENVRKEIQEEYGCSGVIQERLPAHSIFIVEEGETEHWLAIPHFVQIDPDAVTVGEPEKIQELDWFRLSDLPTPLHSGLAYSMKRFSDTFKTYT